MSDDVEAREAVRQAYQAFYRRLVATLYGLTADHAEAQDLVQEAYARALARPRAFLEVSDPEAWLRTVAVNLARTRWRRRRLLDTLIRTGRVTPAPESVPGADPTRVVLVAALAKLSRPTRETIVLHHIADLSVQEVAEQLGVPVGTIKARLSRGRAILADLLQEASPTAAIPGLAPAGAPVDAAPAPARPVSPRVVPPTAVPRPRAADRAGPAAGPLLPGPRIPLAATAPLAGVAAPAGGDAGLVDNDLGDVLVGDGRLLGLRPPTTVADAIAGTSISDGTVVRNPAVPEPVANGADLLRSGNFGDVLLGDGGLVTPTTEAAETLLPAPGRRR